MTKMKMTMPGFTIDGEKDASGKIVMPGIKRMFDIALEIKDSVMQWGLMGIGKSEAVKQWNKQKVKEYEGRMQDDPTVKPWDPKVCDVRLSMKEPVDMIGIPVLSKDESGKVTTVWATPSIWPQSDEYSGGTIHIDEINQGQAAIQNAAFQLIQDRALGEYKVPDGYIIIASGNPSAVNSTVTEFSKPLANRFSHFNIKPDFNSWLDYRMSCNGNLDVLTFLKTQDPSLLFDTKGLEEEIGSINDTMFTDITITPRSWEVVEKVMNLDSSKFSLTEKQMYITGRLGMAVATQFMKYVKDKAKYQSWEEVLRKGKPFASEDLDKYWVTQMACIQAISLESNDETCRKYVLNLLDATRKLKSKALQTVNLVQLTQHPRLIGNIAIFNVMEDASDLVKSVTKAMCAS